MRMNCDRPTYAYLPFEILYLVPDNFGKWGDNWKVHSKHNSKAERDRAFDMLTETAHRRYRKAVNDYEYDAMIAAEYRYEQAHKRPDETDIAGALVDPSISGSFKESTGVDPDDGVLALKYAAGLLDIAAEEDPMAADCYQRALRGESGYIQYTIDQEYNVKVRWVEL